MDVREILAKAEETMTVRRVYGEPYERDGLTIVPAATIRGGGGGGGGESPEGKGSGGGFGMTASPVGAYVIRGDQVRWKPALDWTKIVVLAEVALIVAMLVRRRTRSRGDE